MANNTAFAIRNIVGQSSLSHGVPTPITSDTETRASSNKRSASTSSSPDGEKYTRDTKRNHQINDIDDIGEHGRFALNNTVLHSTLLSESQHQHSPHPDQPLGVSGDGAVIRNEKKEINEQRNEKSVDIWSCTAFIKGNGFNIGLEYQAKTTMWNQDKNRILQIAR